MKYSYTLHPYFQLPTGLRPEEKLLCAQYAQLPYYTDYAESAGHTLDVRRSLELPYLSRDGMELSTRDRFP